MAKRGYKLQEFVAHSAGVTCLNIGKKACRLFVTGGEDHMVNLWTIGKPTSLMSLCGHTSPVESLVFDSAETLVLAGASSGAIKLWDLEEAKMVRTLTGHRSNCTAVEFHPFGEFFASGSLDTNLKIWDIRKKGCIHTYMGHTGGIGSIRFTPDGRWVVSGGFDNVVKVWDLTAGKLLHDFKFHEGPIRSIDFHPLEFLLATGSADKTVKFWDLETFEMIGSSRPEASAVRSITFHPDGRTLLCGLDDSLKVYSWEPVICHDAIDMGWSTLGDLCIHEGKLLGCSYYQNSVGVWVADVSFIDPYGAALKPEQTSSTEHKFNLMERQPLEKVGGGSKSNDLCCLSPEHETIKNIYVDSAGGKLVGLQRVESQNSSKVVLPLDDKEISCRTTDYKEKPVGLQRVGSQNSSKVVLPLDDKEICCKTTQKRSPTVGTPAKPSGQPFRRSFVVPSVVPRDSFDGKGSTNSRRESISTVRAEPKPAHIRRLSNRNYDAEGQLMAAEPGSYCNMTSDLDRVMDKKFQTRLVIEDKFKAPFQEKRLNSESVAEEVEKKDLSPETRRRQESYNEPLGFIKRISPAKPVTGVAPGSLRSLVEKFERRETISDDQSTARPSLMLRGQPQNFEKESTPSNNDDVTEDLMRSHDEFLSNLRSRLTKLQVMCHYWERNDIKGSINAMRKLPDHSVQADLVSVLKDKMEILTLDLFSCLLPVLTSLLGSKMERHANVSLEMLLKLVAIFGPIVQSSISARRADGVDLHAEQRLECCKQCSTELQKIQKILPELTKKGGVLSNCAQELNLLLQEP